LELKAQEEQEWRKEKLITAVVFVANVYSKERKKKEEGEENKEKEKEKNKKEKKGEKEGGDGRSIELYNTIIMNSKRFQASP
jgi:hypothetical protein